jgi:hypothetical protein
MRLEEDEAVLAHDYSETADPTLESEKSITVPGALPINVINLAGGGKEQGEEQEMRSRADQTPRWRWSPTDSQRLFYEARITVTECEWTGRVRRMNSANGLLRNREHGPCRPQNLSCCCC